MLIPWSSCFYQRIHTSHDTLPPSSVSAFLPFPWGRDFSDWQPGRRTWAGSEQASSHGSALSCPLGSPCLVAAEVLLCCFSHTLSRASVLSVLPGCDRSMALMAECTRLIQESSARPPTRRSHLCCYPRFHWWASFDYVHLCHVDLTSASSLFPSLLSGRKQRCFLSFFKNNFTSFRLCWVHCCSSFSPGEALGPLTVVASVVAEHRLQGLRASVAAAHGLSITAPRRYSTGLVVVAHGLSCSA